MEFHQVRYFLAVCDHMNFTRAADACAVSQPALTKAIHKLEDELGGALFLRNGRRTELTDLGRVMRMHLAKILETRDAARDAARTLVGAEMAELDVAIMCTVGPNVLGPALAAFRAAHPGVELVLHDVWAKRAHDLLLSGAVDCALLGRHQPLPERFTAVPLFDEAVALAMAAGHPRAAQAVVAIEDFAGAAYLDRLRCEFRDGFFAALAAAGVAVDVVLRSEREDWIQAAVAAGLGVSILPRHSVVVPGIVTRPVEGIAAGRSVELVTVRDRPLPAAVELLIGFLGRYPWPPDDAP